MMYLLFIPMFFACATESETTPESIPEPPEQPSDSAEPSAEQEPPGINSESLGEGDLYPEQEAAYRNKKRMRISQVQASMIQVSGGIEWNVQNTDKWQQYSETLGVPDYLQRIREEREPSIMFQKFLNDAATESCAEWLDASSDIFQHDPLSSELSEIQQNIDLLRWRIQGHAQGSIDPILHDYLDLYRSVWVRTDDPMTAWHTVCVGMFTHPDFWMY